MSKEPSPEKVVKTGGQKCHLKLYDGIKILKAWETLPLIPVVTCDENNSDNSKTTTYATVHPAGKKSLGCEVEGYRFSVSGVCGL